MPHEMFADAVVRPLSPRARRQRRLLVIVSIGLHVVVAVPIVTVQMLSPGLLPTTRQPMAFQFPNLVKLIDIPMPSAPRAKGDAAPSTEPANPNTVPVREPDGFKPQPAQPARTAGIDDGVPAACRSASATAFPA